jgi:hypothetical protein
VISVGLIGYYGYLIYIFTRNAPACLHSTVTVKRVTQDRRIVFHKEICDGLVHVMMGSLALVYRDGRENRFFQYEDADRPPHVDWQSGVLNITLDSASHIYEQQPSVGGIAVRYHIGHGPS